MKGILMTPANHIATREKRKTMTRRLDGLKEINQEPDKWTYHSECSSPTLGRFTFFYDNQKPYHRETATMVVKPRYNIGETVYLKEAYYFYRRLGTQANIKYIRDDFVTWVSIPKDKPTPTDGYHSPLFLPEWAARDFVKIKGLGIQRLQDISEEDAEKEGAEFVLWHGERAFKYEDFMAKATYRAGFANLWDSINCKRVRSKEYTSTYDWARGGIERKHYTYQPSPYCWDANPFVWIYSYELLESNP